MLTYPSALVYHFCAFGARAFFLPYVSSQGMLRGFDQVQNLVLEHTVEVVYPPASAKGGSVEEMTHGLMVLRGDNVAVVGLAGETEEGTGVGRGGVAMPPITH